MSKKIFITLIFLYFIIPVTFADDFFDNYAGIDNAWDGQKPITNKEFEEAIKVIEGDKHKKEAKKKKKLYKKISGGGTSIHSSLNPENEIPAQESLNNTDNSGELLNIPTDIILGNTLLTPGFYNVIGRRDKKDNKIYLSFYQAHSMLAEIEAYETNDDCESNTINFVKLIPFNNSFVKIMYGSLDFNAYTFAQYKKTED